MKLRGLVVATIVLAGLVGALYWSNRHPKTAETTEATSPQTKILSLKADEVSKVTLQKKAQPTLDLSKNASGQWQITAPEALAADQSAVSGVISTLAALNASRVVEDKAANLAQYGLADPALQALITVKDKTYKLAIGDDTPTRDGDYARLDGDARVFTLPLYEKTGVDKTANDLRDKRLITADSEKTSRIELAARKQTIEFGRDKDQWQIIKPQPLRADSSQVEDLLRTITSAQMELSATDDPKKIAAAFASATPLATAKITDPSGTQELEVRKNKDDYYAKSSVVTGVYKVAGSTGSGLDKGLDDFRNKKLFDLGFNDPNKVEIHDGSNPYFLTRGGEDWWNASGKKLDPGSAQSLIDKLRDLSASKFPDSGFKQPAIEITITSADGKRVEKVQIAKAGDSYIAKRENEPALYGLEASVIADLQKAEADLKPAAPPPPK